MRPATSQPRADRGDRHDGQGDGRPEEHQVQVPRLLAGGDRLRRRGLLPQRGRVGGDRARAAAHEQVGDGEQHGARGEEEQTVEQREAQTHRALRQMEIHPRMR